MDLTTGASVIPAASAAGSLGDQAVTAPLLLIALVIWGVELYQRGALPGSAQVARPYAKACAGHLGSLLPELAGLAVLGTVITALLYRGGNSGAAIATEEDQQLWQDIQRDWPILTTADSLVAIQALLRLALLASAAMRLSEARASPLAGEPAACLLLAALSRVALLALSPLEVYHLDGPLGGAMNVAVEVAALPMLALLCVCTERRGAPLARWSAVAAGVMAACWAAQGNRMALGDDKEGVLDTLFSLSNLLELLAAAAFLGRSVSTAGCSDGAFVWFSHALLPIMQLLPVYFLLTAWGSGMLQSVPELVGAGHPFEVLQTSGAAQVGLYLLAGTLRLAFTGEAAKEVETYLLV